ncbi:MAG: flagellar biosynthesis anti-sigma factor FlgM [Lachnospiraceae bacterium]|nr:flagellar biosynthesis anti-sigma factor FlgM [Lachnospiraceae bacterium]
MRIGMGTLQQVQQLYNSQTNASKTQKEKKTGFMDQLQISSAGKDIQAAKQAVNDAPDIREDVVASIKERIQNGTYSVDAGSFADRLFEKYNNSGMGNF